MQYIYNYKSSIGNILLFSDGEYLTGLSFCAPKLENCYEEKKLMVFEQTITWLNTYFSGTNPNFTPLFRMAGTEFQINVWKLLLKIPYGQTVTYGQLANELALQMGVKRMSAQAVGGAIGRNKIAIIIPCHRVNGIKIAANLYTPANYDLSKKYPAVTVAHLLVFLEH